MEDYKKRKMTKQQLWDKLHAEREMWQMKCQHDVEAAVQQTIIRMRAAIDPVLISMAQSYGIDTDDGFYLDFTAPAEAREGYIWTAHIEDAPSGDLRIIAKEEPIPEENEEAEEE